MYSQFQHRLAIPHYIILKWLKQNLTKTELVNQQQQE